MEIIRKSELISYIENEERWEGLVDMIENCPPILCVNCKHSTTSRTTHYAYNCQNPISPCRGRVTFADFGCSYAETIATHMSQLRGGVRG